MYEVVAALSALGDAQAAIVRVRAKLNVTKARLSCRTVDTGGQDEDNQDFMPTQAALKAEA